MPGSFYNVPSFTLCLIIRSQCFCGIIVLLLASYQSSSVVPLNTIYSIKRNFEQNINSLAGRGWWWFSGQRWLVQDQLLMVVMPSFSLQSPHMLYVTTTTTTTTTYPLVSSIKTSRLVYACRHLSFPNGGDIRSTIRLGNKQRIISRYLPTLL